MLPLWLPCQVGSPVALDLCYLEYNAFPKNFDYVDYAEPSEVHST